MLEYIEFPHSSSWLLLAHKGSKASCYKYIYINFVECYGVPDSIVRNKLLIRPY